MNPILLAQHYHQVYNNHPSAIKTIEKNYRLICEINGVRYESVAEAARITKEKEERIRTKLKKRGSSCEQEPGYVIISKVTQGYSAIIANGRLYDSIVDAVKAGEAKDRFQAMRRLKSQQWKDWNYCSPEKQISK